MDFENKIIEALKKKNLSDSSIKLYIRNIQKLNSDDKLKNLKFLEDVQTITNHIDKYKPNTRRIYLISIISILNSLENQKLKKIADKYYEHMMKLINNIKNNKEDLKMTETQKENWLSFDEVSKKLDELIEKVNAFSRNKTLSEKQYNTLLSMMVLSLYVYNKPKRNQDYQLMNIVYEYNDNLNDDFNYLSYSTNKMIFNVYKTYKKHGQLIESYDEKLKNIIDKYIKFHPLLKNGKIKKDTNVYFLVYYNGQPLKQVNSITRILNKIFDKNIGSSMLRHFYHSSKYGDTIKEMKKDAESMGHTMETVLENYIKVDDTKENNNKEEEEEEEEKPKKRKNKKNVVSFD